MNMFNKIMNKNIFSPSVMVPVIVVAWVAGMELEQNYTSAKNQEVQSAIDNILLEKSPIEKQKILAIQYEAENRIVGNAVNPNSNIAYKEVIIDAYLAWYSFRPNVTSNEVPASLCTTLWLKWEAERYLFSKYWMISEGIKYLYLMKAFYAWANVPWNEKVVMNWIDN